MTFKYNEYIAEHYGARYLEEEDYWINVRGTYLSQDIEFDLETYSGASHGCGIVLPFFIPFLYPHKIGDEIEYSKEAILENLIKWENKVTKTKMQFFDEHPTEAVKMRLALIRYFINCYKSSLTVIERRGYKDYYSDLSRVIGRPTHNQGFNGWMLLKEILIQACDYDTIESQLQRVIFTSKFNPNETFYDWLLMDYRVFQVPKRVYDEKEERYVDWVQLKSEGSDKEIRLGEEIKAIRKLVPFDERYKYFRSDY